MKKLLIAAALLAPLALPAAAQSLHDTHEVSWHPAGKTPAAVHRQRDRADCATIAGRHQSGKTLSTPSVACDGERLAKAKAGTATAAN